MRLMFEIVDSVSDRFVKAVENATESSPEIDLQDYFARFTTDSISNVAFGIASNSLEDPRNEFRKHGKDIIDFSAIDFLTFHFSCSFPQLSRKLHLTANKRNVIKFFYNSFKENMEYRESSSVMKKDFLQILIELKKNASLTLAECAAESFIFFLAGNFVELNSKKI